ncbi:hypothetical protein OIV83_003724 [Microbotryomycetes sp. JL201]|nr:hypothetical protein OIV83_003724 [Microbotryomycetes sp. JL201]
MAPLAMPLGEHPDGDPFAEQDRAAFANSALGRMEQRWARVEQEQADKSSSASTATRGGGTGTAAEGTRRASSRVATKDVSNKAQQRAPVVTVPSINAPSSQADDVDDKMDQDKRDEPDSKVEHEQDEEDIADTGDEDEDEDEEENEADKSSVHDSEDERQVAAQMRGEKDSEGVVGTTENEDDEAGQDDEDDEEDDNSEDGDDDEGVDEREGDNDQDGDVSMVDASVNPTRESSPTRAVVNFASSHRQRLSRADSLTSLTSIDSPRQSSQPPPNGTDATASRTKTATESANGSVDADTSQPKQATTRRKSQATVAPPAKPKPTFAKQQGTVRIEITLPQPGSTTDVPRFSIVEKARDAGFIPEEEELAEGKSENDDSEGSEGEGDKEGRTKAGPEEEHKEGQADIEPPPPKKRKRGKNAILGRWGGYDVDDPFVDDSELNLYEPKYYVPPKRKGFFVCTGEVEVERKSGRRGRVPGSKNKPKIEGAAEPKPTASTSTANAQTPGGDTKPAVPSFMGSPGPPKKREGFSPELQKQLDMLKAEVAKESFEVKSKFPPRLKPILVDVAMLAVELGEFDDDFLAVLPKIFPYNLFTMKKLVKREIFPQRVERLKAEIESQMKVLKQGVEENYPQQKAEFQAALAKWQVDNAEYQEEKAKKGGGTWIAPDANGVASTRATPEPAPIAPIAAVTGTPVDSGTGANERTSTPQLVHEDPDAPVKPKWKFRFTEPMRMALLRIVDADEEISNLIIEKQNLEKAVEKGERQHSTMVQRRELYTRVADLWPQGEIATNQLSREMSAFKTKLKRKEGHEV